MLVSAIQQSESAINISISWRRQWYPLQSSCLENPLERRSLVGCSQWGREESDTTERLHFHFSLSCIGEGNGNPLQCSCLENPRDGRAWWAAIYGVAQSQTRLQQLSSSSIPISMPSWASLSPTPHSTLRGHHRAANWPLPVIQQCLSR